MSVRDDIAEEFPEALFLDPASMFDQAIIGIAQQAGGLQAVAYDVTKCIIAMIESGMTEEDAQEFFEYNTASAYVGKRTPVFVVSADTVGGIQ